MQSGSPLFMLLLLGIMMLVLIVLPARRAKKAQQQIKERQDAMVPGTQVMTNFGLYGSVVSIDKEANTAHLEIAPGTVAKVHLMTVTSIEEDTATAPVADAERPVIQGEVADDPKN
ncbi:preprotein translocase subunit YajC [Rothia nasimurium]|uniref:Preprotein translocase subunit YajC n=1 Tax=Candidatus Rothia avicola TaxID=2840478 RepID=A0A9D1ZTI4_9MICC|nr:preprotein translocase subunit YajC [Rothia nasimurium]HIY95485.1 preprotein translocase subunit YajC [Candidatus Rothia avicola]